MKIQGRANENQAQYKKINKTLQSTKPRANPVYPITILFPSSVFHPTKHNNKDIIR